MEYSLCKLHRRYKVGRLLELIPKLLPTKPSSPYDIVVNSAHFPPIHSLAVQAEDSAWLYDTMADFYDEEHAGYDKMQPLGLLVKIYKEVYPSERANSERNEPLYTLTTRPLIFQFLQFLLRAYESSLIASAKESAEPDLQQHLIQDVTFLGLQLWRLISTALFPKLIYDIKHAILQEEKAKEKAKMEKGKTAKMVKESRRKNR